MWARSLALLATAVAFIGAMKGLVCGALTNAILSAPACDQPKLLLALYLQAPSRSKQAPTMTQVSTMGALRGLGSACAHAPDMVATGSTHASAAGSRAEAALIAAGLGLRRCTSCIRVPPLLHALLLAAP